MTQSATFKGFLSSSNTMVVSRLLQTPINVWYFQKKWQGTIKRWHSLFQTLEKCLIYTFVTLNNNSPAVLIQLCSREWIKDCVTKKRYSKPLFLLSPQVTYPNSYREFGCLCCHVTLLSSTLSGRQRKKRIRQAILAEGQVYDFVHSKNLAELSFLFSCHIFFKNHIWRWTAARKSDFRRDCGNGRDPALGSGAEKITNNSSWGTEILK